SNSLVDQRVGIVDINPETDGRTTELVRGFVRLHGVAHHDARGAHAELGVQHLAVGSPFRDNSSASRAAWYQLIASAASSNVRTGVSVSYPGGIGLIALDIEASPFKRLNKSSPSRSPVNVDRAFLISVTFRERFKRHRGTRIRPNVRSHPGSLCVNSM